MERSAAIAQSTEYYTSGRFFDLLAKRIAIPSTSQDSNEYPKLYDYLEKNIIPYLKDMGFSCEVIANPICPGKPFWPILLATRIENPTALTALLYGHGDVVNGYDEQWQEGLSPWKLTIKDEKWYGRGTADNKGQHSVNLAALETLIKCGEPLGFNVKLIIEMGEEAGSPGLNEFCKNYKDRLTADVFIGSDGPRVGANLPTLFLGSRGNFSFDLSLNLREGSYHSGNWGGVLANAGTRLMNAWSSIVDANGRILIPGLKPKSIPERVHEAIKDIPVGAEPGAPALSENWGEPGLTPQERLWAWNTIEVIAAKVGNPEAPANAIQGKAWLRGQIRYIAGSDREHFTEILRNHLDEHGFSDVKISTEGFTELVASRLDPDNPWVDWTLTSLQASTGKKPTLLPNMGGAIPNPCFSDTLGLPTLWIPHSYPGCLQHGPNEHLYGSLYKEGLEMMTGLFWDLGHKPPELA